VRGGDIGADRVVGPAPLTGQIFVPAPRDGVRAVSRREAGL
jgi:hypothetical protein